MINEGGIYGGVFLQPFKHACPSRHLRTVDPSVVLIAPLARRCNQTICLRGA